MQPPLHSQISAPVTAEGIPWSWSWLAKYEECAFRFKLGRILKLPEPPLPPDNPMERGNRIHKSIEQYIKGETDSLASCEAKAIDNFEHVYGYARELYSQQLATVEDNWWFDSNWNRCERENVWLWVKADLTAVDKDRKTAIVVDVKSGKKGYKIAEHIQQTQLYAGAQALREPWAETIVTELHYVDDGSLHSEPYSRDKALSYVGMFDARAKRIYQDTVFKPNPNIHTCRYCPYSPRGTGACPVGV